MPQLGTADVTYTKLEGNMRGNAAAPESEYQFLMLFPNSTNVLYTNGGIPINKGSLGCPGFLTKFIIEDMASSTGYVAKWDQSANTVRLWWVAAVVTGAATPAQQLVEVLTSATVASVTLRAIVQGW
jgi:hypothetical protein